MTAYVCKDLPIGSVSTMMTTSLCWMASIRLTHLMLLPDEERQALTLRDYAAKFLWFVFPVLKNPTPREGTQWLGHVAYNAALGLGKMVLRDWLGRWLLYSLEQVGGGEVVRQSYLLTLQYTAMFAVLVMASIPTNDFQRALVSLLTKDR